MNKIIIKETEEGRWGAVIRSANGKDVWEIPIKGLKHQKSVQKAVKMLSKPFKVVVEKKISNITG